MVLKLVLVLGLFAISLGLVLGAPRAIHNEKELEMAVRQFLSEDKVFLRAVERASAVANDRGMKIRKRRAEGETDAPANTETTPVDVEAGGEEKSFIGIIWNKFVNLFINYIAGSILHMIFGR